MLGGAGWGFWQVFSKTWCLRLTDAIIEKAALDSAGGGEKLAVEKRDGSFGVGRVSCVQGVQFCMRYVKWVVAGQE